MKIMNLTPHPLNMVRSDGTVLTILPEGTPARVSVQRTLVGELEGFPVNVSVFGKVEGMPAPADNTAYVVSMLVASALKAAGNTDGIYIVDDTVRDAEGKIIGAKGFGKV